MKKVTISLLLLAFALGYFTIHSTYTKVYLTYVSNNDQSSERIVQGLAAYQKFADKAVLVTNRPGQASALGELITTPDGMAMLTTSIPKTAHTFRDGYAREASARNTCAILSVIVGAFGFGLLFMRKPSPTSLPSDDALEA